MIMNLEKAMNKQRGTKNEHNKQKNETDNDMNSRYLVAILFWLTAQNTKKNLKTNT